jgi:hypothetical protein
VPQIIVVVEILIAKRHAEYALPDHRCDFVFDQLRAPRVMKARRKSIDQPNRTIGCTQK